jgi:hypothetical protein
MSKTQSPIFTAVEEVEAIIEALNDFYKVSVIEITCVNNDDGTEETYYFNKYNDVLNYYIKFCYIQSELWQSINNFLETIFSNELLADYFTDYVHNDVVKILNQDSCS